MANVCLAEHAIVLKDSQDNPVTTATKDTTVAHVSLVKRDAKIAMMVCQDPVLATTRPIDPPRPIRLIRSILNPPHPSRPIRPIRPIHPICSILNPPHPIRPICSVHVIVGTDYVIVTDNVTANLATLPLPMGHHVLNVLMASLILTLRALMPLVKVKKDLVSLFFL